MKEFIYRNGGTIPDRVGSRIRYKYQGVVWADTTPYVPLEVHAFYTGEATEETHGYFLNNEPTRAFKVVSTVDFYCFGFPRNMDDVGYYLIPYSESYDSATGYYTKIYEAYSQYQPHCRFDSWLFEITKKTYTTDSNNRRLMDNITNNEIISIETYQGWLSHDISEYGWSRYTPIATTANIGITCKIQYASGGWVSSYYTDNTQSTPLYYIEKTNEDRVIQMITYGSVGNYEVLICDTTGGDNISNITKPTYNQTTIQTPNTYYHGHLWEIQVPANKRLLLLEITGSAPGSYTSYYYYKGYNNPEIGLRVIPWENAILHQYTQTGSWQLPSSSPVINYRYSIGYPSGTYPNQTATLAYSSGSSGANQKIKSFEAQPNTTYKLRYTLTQSNMLTPFFGGTIPSSFYNKVGAQIGTGTTINFMTEIETKNIGGLTYETTFKTPASTTHVIVDGLGSYDIQPVLYEQGPGWTND